jgi:thymidylate synthase (FAD)|nr:MAG TPA: Thymidylate synthase complementing protein [Caudoviricetes sp.]
MKLVKPSFEILEQKPREIIIPADMEIGPRMAREELINSVYRQIEIAGRTCYKSEDKITPDSAKKFVERMVKSGHGAMLEHGTVYLFLTMSSRQQYFKYCSNPYSVANSTGEAEKGTWNGFVTTNYRVLVENGWLEDLEYICNPGKEHEKRITVRFVCDRGVSHEFVRHRVFSFAQESTRYCNYAKDKFGNELTFIIPRWLSLSNGSYIYDYPNGFTKDGSKWDSKLKLNTFLLSLVRSEAAYLELISQGWVAQQARAVLPNSLKTELIMTGTLTQWEGFFKLRDAESAHPQARELAEPLHAEFRKRGWCE